MADSKAPSKTGPDKAAPETTPAPVPSEAPAAVPASDTPATSTPEPPSGAPVSPSGHWRFTGPYAAIYLPPDRVSRWIQPVEVVDWGPDGPPDGHWEPSDAPTEPAPSASDDTKKE